MLTAVFLGTFDPLHGAHIGQMLRAHHYKSFDKITILVDKHAAHKPHASSWQHRLRMAELALDSFDLPFTHEVVVVEDLAAPDFTEAVDYKITGIDSLLESLTDKDRWHFSQRWPMIVLSIPGIPENDLSHAVQALPDAIRSTITYEYVDESAAPMMNYDFEKQAFITRRIHSTQLRSGKDSSLIPPDVQAYIREHGLYAKKI